MAKKNFDAFINAAGKKPKPTPEEVEAMAKQLHQAAAVPQAATVAAEPPAAEAMAKPAKEATPPVAKQKPKSPAPKADRPSMTARQPVPTEAPKEKVRITIDLAKDLYKRMKLAVVQNETEISAYVRQLIEDDLNQKKG